MRSVIALVSPTGDPEQQGQHRTGVAMALHDPLSGFLGLRVPLASTVPGPLWWLLAIAVPAAGTTAGALAGARVALREDPYLAARCDA